MSELFQSPHCACALNRKKARASHRLARAQLHPGECAIQPPVDAPRCWSAAWRGGNGSAAVGRLAVRADVQAFALVLFGDAQADRHVDDLVGDEGHDRRPHHGDQHALGLDQHLAADGEVVAAGAAQAGRGEHAGQQRAQDAADAVHAEHVERVVRAEHALEAVDTPQAQEAGQQADDDARPSGRPSRRPA